MKGNDNIVGFKSNAVYNDIKNNVFTDKKLSSIVKTYFKPTKGIRYLEDQIKKYGTK